MSLKFMAVVLVLMVAVSAGAAAPNLNGASGYVQMPDAAVLAPGEMVLSAGYVESDGSNELSVLDVALPCVGDGYNLRWVAGVGSDTEVGIGFLNIDKENGDADAVTIAVKSILMDKPAEGLMVALGASYRDWSSDLQFVAPSDTIEIRLPEVTSAYLVLDKSWAPGADSAWGWKASVGVSYDRFSAAKQKAASGSPFFIVPGDVPIDAGGEVDKESFFSPFVGVQASNGEWSIMGEYKPEMDEKNFIYASEVWSAAIAKEFASGLKVTAGVTNFNLPYTDSDTDWFVDLAYTFAK